MKTKIQLINNHYSRKDTSILLEQYKIITASADKITDKRQNANKFYLGINSFIFAVSGYFTTTKISIVPLLISTIGFLISIVWHQNINSFKRLNSAKFKVIHEMESHLPANVYRKEDEYLQKGYYKLTSVEKWVPLIFGVSYALVIVHILIKCLIKIFI